MDTEKTSDKPQTAAPVFFYKLNQIRLLGAMLVFITHVEMTKYLLQLPSVPYFEVLRFGHQGLNFFFVLSGFLITYLMLREFLSTGTVNIRNFYMRRILRVWPLYYLVIVLAFTVGTQLDRNLPTIAFDAWREMMFHHYRLEALLYGCMIPNLVLCFIAPPTCAGPAWTVGVEEQFYLFWPFLFLLCRKRIWMMMPISIGVKYALLRTIAIVSASIPTTDHDPQFYLFVATNFVKHFDIEGLAAGSLAAYLLLTKPAVVKFLTGPRVRFGVLIPAIIACPLIPQLHSLDINTGPIDFGIADLIFAISFAWVCIILATNNERPKTLVGKAINYGGTITYGFYMYHMFGIMLALQLLNRIPNGFLDPLVTNSVLYILPFTLSMIVSAISYEFYESKVQRLKRYFSYAKPTQPASQAAC